MNMMRPEDPKHRAKIVKRWNKREYYVIGRKSMPEEAQHINGYKREEWKLLQKDGDDVKLCVFHTPVSSRYGPQVLAKRYENGRYWFISAAYAEALPQRHIDAMEAVASGEHPYPRFNADVLSPIYD